MWLEGRKILVAVTLFIYYKPVSFFLSCMFFSLGLAHHHSPFVKLIYRWPSGTWQGQCMQLPRAPACCWPGFVSSNENAPHH